MAGRKTTATAAAPPAAERGPKSPDNSVHPTDPRIYSDGRPIPQKSGNPHQPGTAAAEHWDREHA